MFIKGLVAIISCLLFFSTSTALADITKNCNDTQETNCGRFCMMHQGVRSCVVDVTKREGTCTCHDGASHSKSKK